MFRSTDSGTRGETNKRQSITGEVTKKFQQHLNSGGKNTVKRLLKRKRGRGGGLKGVLNNVKQPQDW